MSFRLVQELAADGVRVAVACRMLQVSASGYYEWCGRPPSLRAVADEALSAQIREIHACSGPMACRACTPNCGSGAACAVAASAWPG